MNEISFRVNGMPGAQGSKKLSRWGAMIEASPRVHPWRQDVKFAAQNAYKGDPLEGAVSVAIEFIFPSFSRYSIFFLFTSYDTFLRLELLILLK